MRAVKLCGLVGGFVVREAIQERVLVTLSESKTAASAHVRPRARCPRGRHIGNGRPPIAKSQRITPPRIPTSVFRIIFLRCTATISAAFEFIKRPPIRRGITALLAGAVPLRHPAKMAMLKPRPMNYTPDLGHLATCTSCQNARPLPLTPAPYRPKMRSGAPHLLVDDAALDSWSGVVLELEAPRKGRALFKQPALRKTRRSPSVLYRDHPVPRVGSLECLEASCTRAAASAWLGQASTKYCESEDGIHFDSCAGLDRGLAWLPQPIPYSVLNGKFGGQTESVRQRQQGTSKNRQATGASLVTTCSIGVRLLKRRLQSTRTRPPIRPNATSRRSHATSSATHRIQHTGCTSVATRRLLINGSPRRSLMVSGTTHGSRRALATPRMG